ncbi:SMC5-SMC6 complex localization factor protein 2 [Xenentodon cancila]
MKKATENQATTRTLAENLSPRIKVRGLALQQNSLPHFTSFSQETPMKPSQVPNWLSNHPSRRALPLQTPEQCNKDRFVSNSHSPCPARPMYSSGLVPPNEEVAKRISEENQRKDKSSKAEVPQKGSSTSVPVLPNRPSSGHTPCSAQVLPVKIINRCDQVRENRKTDCNTPKTSKPNSGTLSCRALERSKMNRGRRPVIPDDIDQLFTPDPKTYVVSPTCKTAKPKIDGETIKSPISEKASSPTSGSSPSVTGSSCHKTLSRVTELPHTRPASKRESLVGLPTVTLERVKLEKLNFSSKDKGLTNSPISSESQPVDVKSDNNCTLLDSSYLSSSYLNSDAAASEQTSSSQCTPSQSLEKQASEKRKKEANEEDPIDVDLDLGFSFKYSLDVTQSSDSSEEEQLMSLQEMMECVAKPPHTPEKGAFSEPSTPGHKSSPPKTVLSSTIKLGVYKNNLDRMLEEINNNKRAKEVEAELLTACQEDLLRIAEYEEAEENQEDDISTEQQEFLLRYSLMSSAIREVPPGEAVFNLERFGHIFDQNTLQLRQCMVSPQGTAQKALLWSSPAQLRLHVIIGLFQDAYDYSSPCPPQVTRFLFKMMSVHSERMVSEKILQALNDIACSAAYQIGKNGSHQFEVWVPSLADVTLVLMNMGVSFVALFPFENLQPLFTEGDLLEDIYIKSESPSTEDQLSFSEHNCSNILKYLSYCMGLCPRAYSDEELLFLLIMVGKISLDTSRILQSTVEVTCLQYKIVNNIRDWDAVLPRICLALTDLTDDHHNMCLLVQLLPDNTRGKQLRRHLSLSMISKLLDGSSSYRPTQEEFQLADLRPYLPRMQPSALLRGLYQKDKEEDLAVLDQQAYYLCHSLLTLTNEASNFQFFPAHQKAQLLVLSYALETHVKCDIRENEKCLYRSKVKDLVARIYTKWQMLLQRTRPLNGKLYDYWQPVTTFGRSQEDGEDTGVEEAEEEEKQTTLADENDEVVVEGEEEEKQVEKMEPEEDMELDQRPEEKDDVNKTTEATQAVTGDFKQERPELQPQVMDEQSNNSLGEQSGADNETA